MAKLITNIVNKIQGNKNPEAEQKFEPEKLQKPAAENSKEVKEKKTKEQIEAEKKAAAEAAEKKKLNDEFAALMDYAWSDKDYTFLREMSYTMARDWYLKMLETFAKEAVPNKDGCETIIDKANSVRAWRKQRNLQKRQMKLART